ncbi:arylamine N-acetyltransferase [Rhodotorula toruloides]|uniref:Arylamine N-acetyltransferase n=1 Tax=Rhodotorula toruloides TaxID=5286 RepID=A0A511KMW0_RHOTO|nr:arylamine N-acetyltransferase [Rhodotorula toruloides]
MSDGIPLDPWQQITLSRPRVEAYLKRIQLPLSTLDEKPSLPLLAKLMQSQLENIPKDTTPMHVEEWDGPSKPIKLSSVLRMPEGVEAFDRIVTENKGAFCFAVNPTFAAFLRFFGFQVSELVGRTFKSLGNDPRTHPDGWKWGMLTHELMVAHWEGSDARYLVDAAWGPWGCPVPVKLSSGETVLGLNEYEGFKIVNEQLPLSPHQTPPIDTMPGWTFYRFIPPPNTPLSLPIDDSTPGYWSPQFHFHLLSIPLLDYRLLHHFSATHEVGSFYAFWLVTRLLPGTGGARRSMMFAEKEGQDVRRAKVYTTGGHDGKGCLEGRDVEWVDMETGPMREYLEREFGYKF